MKFRYVYDATGEIETKSLNEAKKILRSQGLTVRDITNMPDEEDEQKIRVSYPQGAHRLWQR
jgi:beta-lactam-binding protein with PASTA domain